ncbi:MAG: GspH/FimT family protein [Candidatus Binatia bacterium]|nr:GspH/FimT family protein [Candidatus Binatia bacterium]
MRLGLTVLELLLAITVLGIVSGIASLRIPRVLADARLYSGVRQIAADLHLVRMKAIAQNSRFRVTFRPRTNDYVVDKEERGTWRRQLLHGHHAGPSAAALLTLPSGVRIVAVNSGGDVVFLPRGYVDGGITITLRSDQGTGSKRVVINLAGRVRIE